MRLTRIGTSPTVRDEHGRILASFFTEDRRRLAGQFVLAEEAINLLRMAQAALQLGSQSHIAERIRAFLKAWEAAE